MQLYPKEDSEDGIMLVSLMQMMLHLNPQERITPNEALIHAFLRLSKTYLLFAPMMSLQMVLLSADVTSAASDDVSVAPVITGLNDTVSAGGEVSESSAGLADDSDFM